MLHMSSSLAGRQKQKERTRRAIVAAAAQLIAAGHLPTTAEVADAALVSLATAYRYFPDHLDLLSAALQDASSGIAAYFQPDLDEEDQDPISRIDAATAALLDRYLARDRVIRAVMALSLLRSVDDTASAKDAAALRPGVRRPWIEAAVRLLEGRVDPARLARLKLALGAIMSPEALIALQDVMHASAAEAVDICRWMARTLAFATISAPDALPVSGANSENRSPDPVSARRRPSRAPAPGGH
jgi:AcrR family transcriptional regulator